MESLENNIADTALIFEGGAMRACYSAAVVAEFLRDEIFFNWVAGISAGSSNACNYLSRDIYRARRSFVEFAADPEFGGLQSFSRGTGLFNAHYIYETSGAPDANLPFDLDTFRRNPAQIRIGAYRATDGQMFYWGKEDIKSVNDLMIRVRASSTLPFFMPVIEVDGEPFVDGALGPAGGIAIDAAKADGFKRFVVILTRPRDYFKKPAKDSKLVRQYLRKYPAVAEGAHERWKNYNRSKEEVFDLETDGKAYVFTPEGYLVGTSERNVKKLNRSYSDGKRQIRRELPAIRDFLGLGYR